LRYVIIILILLIRFASSGQTCDDSLLLTKSDSLKFHLPKANLFIELFGAGKRISFNTEIRLYSTGNNAFCLRLGKGLDLSNSSAIAYINYYVMTHQNISMECGIGASYCKNPIYDFTTNKYLIKETEKHFGLSIGMNFFAYRNMLFKFQLYFNYIQYHEYFNNHIKGEIYDYQYSDMSIKGGFCIGYSFRRSLLSINDPEAYKDSKKMKISNRESALIKNNSLFLSLLGTSVLSFGYERNFINRNRNVLSAEISYAPITYSEYIKRSFGFSFGAHYRRCIFRSSQIETGATYFIDNTNYQYASLNTGFRHYCNKNTFVSLRFTPILTNTRFFPMINFRFGHCF
jgi:hypothetical protein